MKKANISLFVPHEGCPYRCVFCDQRAISGQTKRVTKEDVDRAVSIALRTLGDAAADAEIAFFGGSFTAIERDYMCSLLEAASEYVRQGVVGGIRCSTRPDAVDDEVLEIFKRYGGTSVELGCQSMNDRVLELNRRGHTVKDTERAAKLIKSSGLSLGVQMMTGMYGDDDAGTLETARRLIALRPDTARIYPTVVLEHTALAALYRSGEYRPQTVDQAVQLCAVLLEMFEEQGVKVIKLGLHAAETVEQQALAGAYHPAFRELCEGQIFLKRAKQLLCGRAPGEYTLAVAPGSISKMTGQKKCNIASLAESGLFVRVIGDAALSGYEIKVIE